MKPVYTGSYQDSVVKAMTAAKAGNAPDVAMLLSTDMFTLIDDDLIEPYDAIAKSESDQDWIKSFYPAFMENSQAGGHTWGIPFQRSTIVQYWNKDAFKAAGLDPEKPPAYLGRDGRVRKEADEARCLRRGHPVGPGDTVVRIPLLAVSGADHPERRHPRQSGRHQGRL